MTPFVIGLFVGAVSDRTYDRKREAADEKKERLRDGQTVDGKPR